MEKKVYTGFANLYLYLNVQTLGENIVRDVHGDELGNLFVRY